MMSKIGDFWIRLTHELNSQPAPEAPTEPAATADGGDAAEASTPSGFTPASDGASMIPFVHWVHTFSTLKPQNVFEIGANMGQDAEALRVGFGLEPKDVWVFEPHPDLHRYITEKYDFNAFDVAVLDADKPVTIHAVDPEKTTNSGISSARVHKDVPEDHFKSVEVKGVRMDSFITEHKISSIDFLKLDVEGCNYEVLEGFGDKLDVLKCLHIEAEHHEHWEGEKLWEDVRAKLEPHFEMVFFERHFTQSDSLWIRKDLIRSV